MNRTITTGAGNDTIYIGDGGYYGTGSSIIKAGEGDDNIHINAGDHKIYGESGINRIYLSSVDMEQTTTIFAGKGGTDILIFNDDICFIFLTCPSSIIVFPTNPTLCPPLNVINPFFISSIKECIEYLHII